MLAQAHSPEKASNAAYDRWIGSLLSAMVNMQAQAMELTALADEFSMDQQEIARVLAEQLVESARSDKAMEFSELKAYLKAYAFKEYLEKELPPKTVERIRRVIKL